MHEAKLAPLAIADPAGLAGVLGGVARCHESAVYHVKRANPPSSSPRPLALAVGSRIRQLRVERGLTAEALAFTGKPSSKGFVSDIEKGLAMPSVTSLHAIAEVLDVALLDLLTFPGVDERQALVDHTRRLSKGAVRKLLKEFAAGQAPPLAANPRAKPATVVRKASRRRG